MTTPFAIFPNRHAFLLGAQAYTDAGIRSLETPRQDIQLMGKALAAYGYQIHLYPDPNKATFVRLLESIPTLDADGDAQIVIYYAGHGVALTQQQTDGPPIYGGYLLPIDARRGQFAETAISMQWIADQIKQFNGKQVLLILDCCYAGAMRQAAASFRGGIDTESDEISQDDFGHYTRYRANQILTSSAHNQQALDQYVGSDSADQQATTSPFATLLARALTNRDADSNRDGIVTVYELQLYIQQRLEAAASLQQHEQTSCLFDFSSHEGGEFLFLEPSFTPTSLGKRQRVNPYKGLDAYQPEDSSLFYGRDSAISRLSQLLDNETFVVVVGASGTGKSSLVKAGVLGPCRRAGTTYATIRPGKNPLAELDRIRENPPHLLLIDQMEELVTQADNHSDEKLGQFFDGLRAFQRSEAGRHMKVVATLRIEFVPQINRLERFWNTDKQQYTIPVLDVDALQEIIIRPALQTGMFYYPEKETVARIIEDFRHYPNALPLLSLALNELYERGKDRPERTIYERDYPGIGQILEQKEETILEPFRENIGFFRDLLLRFVAFQGGEFVRRRVDAVELDFGPHNQPLCTQMLKTLTENRLLTGRDAEAGDGYYELTHEALIGSWQTYRQWIQQLGSAQLTQREELAEAAQRYVQLGSRRTYTWGSTALMTLIRAGRPANARLSRFWNFRSFSSQFRQLSWLSVPERIFIRRSFGVQLQNKLALAGLGMIIFVATSIALFLQTRDDYSRLLNNAQYAESQNAYKTAQKDYKAADTLANRSVLLGLGRRFLRIPPDSLPVFTDLAGQRDVVFTSLNRELARADTLTTNLMLLLAGRNDQSRGSQGVAQACRAFGQFIQTDALYRALDDSLRQPQTRSLLDNATLGRLLKRAREGYRVTGVMRENLLAICREVQEGYLLNRRPDLATQYSGYIDALDTYQQKVSTKNNSLLFFN
ncbi:nSTAND1 domain-containing NTPase [Spirosoma jeollabukense]